MWPGLVGEKGAECGRKPTENRTFSAEQTRHELSVSRALVTAEIGHFGHPPRTTKKGPTAGENPPAEYRERFGLKTDCTLARAFLARLTARSWPFGAAWRHGGDK
jgi:hypothetical protein